MENLDQNLRSYSPLHPQPQDANQKFANELTGGIPQSRIQPAGIDRVRWYQVQAGTAILGGQGNGNGLLSVQNSNGNEIVKVDQNGIIVKNTGGTEIVTMNENGIVVNEGDITIKNSGGTTVIDSSGLVSTAAFQFGGTTSLNNTRTNSVGGGTWNDVANTSLSIVLPRSTNVLFLCYGNFDGLVQDGNIASVHVALNVGGTLFPDSSNGFGNVFFGSDTAGSDVSTYTTTFQGHSVVLVGAGTTTAKMQWFKGNSANVDARVSNTILTYLVLGT